MRYYPVFLDLSRRVCLVVGLGRVGRRKLEGLLASGPQKVVGLDVQAPGPGIIRLLDRYPNFTFLHRSFEPEDLHGVSLVFACCAHAEINARIARACAEAGVWCNAADDPEAGDFILPSVCRRGDLSVAVSTAGQSPAVARMVRKELDDFLGLEYAVLLRLLGRIRKDLLDCGLGCDHNQDVFRGLAASELKAQLACGDSEGAARTLRSHLPEVLHSQIGVYLDGITNPA